MFGALAQASAPEKRESATLSKYQIKVNRDTKKRITTDSELDEMTRKSEFNFHYSTFLKSEATNKNYTALLQAYELDSTNSELFFELAKYNEVIGNEKLKKVFCEKLRSNKLTAALREYAYNTLMSVEKNGILVTYGELDTYPIWVLQSIEKIRNDVAVLNYDLLINQSYRKRKAKELGIKFSKQYKQNLGVLKDVAIKNNTISVYYSLTVSHLILQELKSNLYSTGLALKYSQKTVDNVPLLKQNWENNFLKSEMLLSKTMESDKQMHLNYILPLLQLNEHYKNEQLLVESAEIIAVIKTLAKQAGKQQEVSKLLVR